jgi:H+-translocating NAD(P) transhydrogenase subunit alpha
VIVASIKEDINLEKRISVTPETAKSLISIGLGISLEKNYAVHLGIKDKDYEDQGVKFFSNSSEVINSSDLILRVNCPNDEDVKSLNEKQIIIGMFNPSKNIDILKKILQKKINIFSLELLPRISRAQSMDVLSSQSNLAGYRAVVDSIYEFERALPMMMTAAGTVPAAKVLVIGAGVAGLQETAGGYAKEASEEFKKKQADLLKDALKKNDIVVCTALIPGKAAPKIINEELVKLMKPGSIIYDLAAEQGGNSAYSEPDKINIINGVKVIGPKNLMNKLPLTASNLYAKNLFSFVRNLYSKEKKSFDINLEDEIISKTLIKE